MPSSPFRGPEGTIPVGEFIEVRALFDGLGILLDESVPGNGTANNDASPLNMNGQKGIFLTIECTQAATLQLFNAEVENGVVVGIYALQDSSGNNITATVVANVGITKCYPDLYAEHLVVRLQNDSASANSVYVRVI